MPWFVVVVCAFLVGACSFDGDYAGGHYTCSDDVCPSGLVCVAGECVSERKDAALDTSMIDARLAALTCADPGLFATAGGTFAGSTASRSSTISAMCGGFVMNGADAVYRVDAASGDVLHVSVSGSFAVSAYVIAPCSVSPATPTCLTNTAATPGNPINVTTTFAGQHFVIVDATNAAASGDYTLTLGVN